MVNRKILSGVLLIAFVGILNVQAQAGLADWHYERAVAAYSGGDCVNASEHVSAAFDEYSATGDLPGISKCNDLIKKINDCLRPIGDQNYLQALDYAIKGGQYLDSGDYEKAKDQFDLALVYLLKANHTFQHMLPRDTERIAKIDIQYSQVAAKIKEGEIMKADELYGKALVIVEEEDYKQYTTALLYVENASAIYQRYDVGDSIRDCEILRGKIIDLIAEAAERAGYLYEQGINAYQSANCTNDGFFEARTYFQNSRNTYILVNYFDRAGDCELILSQVNESIKNCREDMLKALDKSIKEAKTKRALIQEGNCSAYDEVEELVKTARQRAVELHEMFGTGDFWNRNTECEELLKKIGEDKEKCETVMEADKLYAEAYKLSQQAEYEKSLKRAVQAKEIFEKNKDFAGITRCERLIDSNNRMLVRLNESNAYYEKGLEYYKVADFDNALNQVLKARAIYENISRFREVEVCNSTIKDIYKGNETKNKAAYYYEEALKYHSYRDYGTALENAEKARDLYKKINHAEGLKNAEKLIADMPIKEPTPWILLLVVASVLFIFLLWSRTKISRARKKKEVEDESKRLEEEKRKAELEAEKGRREAEKRKMMEERSRLRELVEEEKKRAGTKEKKEEKSEVDDRAYLEEMIRREEEAIKKEERELRGEREKPKKKEEGLDEVGAGGHDDPRAMLEEMIDQESESIKREKAVVLDNIEWERDKIGEIVDKGKDILGREKKGVLDDRNRLKGIIETEGGDEEGIHQPMDDSPERLRMKEIIKKERESMKKSEADDTESSDS
ncbi:MAG: hypothetical protein JW778_03865 [Candidatus Altiarchaeota archaeon]|nr:hypothetical protein [Candidatus Altiarchaeota archaeon]